MPHDELDWRSGLWILPAELELAVKELLALMLLQQEKLGTTRLETKLIKTK